MNSNQHVENDGNSKRLMLPNSIRIFAVVFVGTLLAGIVATIAFSASGCPLSAAIRCFSISRDAVGASLLGFKMWSWPAFVAAVFVAAIAGIRGKVVWWNILILAPASDLLLALFVGSVDRYMVPEFAVYSVLLFTFVQLSLFVGRLSGGVSA